MFGRLGGIGLLCIGIASAGPGDIDTTFAEAKTFERALSTIAKDGTIWVGGLGDVIHLSVEGKLLGRYPCLGHRIRPVAHPKGGVVIGGRQISVGEDISPEGTCAFWIQSNGQVAAAFKPPALPNNHRARFYAAGDLLWMFSDRKLTALDEKGAPQATYTYPWWSIEFVSSAPNGTVAVIGTAMPTEARRGYERKLVYYSAKDGTIVSEHEPSQSLNDSIAILKDGRFLVAGNGLTRFLSTGKHDPSYQSPFKEPVRGDPTGMAATDKWTYYEGPRTRLHRMESGDLRLSEKAISFAGESLSERVRRAVGQDPKALVALKLAEGGDVLKENRLHLGNASVGAFPRGDGYDDLIVAEWGPIKGLIRLVNSKDPEKPWRREAIRGEWTSQLKSLVGARVKRRIAIGKINGDDLDDVLEWRSPIMRNAVSTLHWYRGEEKEGQRILKYDGVLDCADLPKGVNFADVCLADIDGDGDNDILMRGTRSLMRVRFFLEDDREPALIWWRNDGVTKPWPMIVVDDSVTYAGISSITEDDDSLPASNLHLEDLDGDKDPDIAIVRLKETVAQTWFINEGGKFTKQGRDPITGQWHGGAEEGVGPTITGKDRPALMGFDRWKGRLVTRADVNGDGVLDRILAYPGFELDNDDSDLTWKRGLKWENGKQSPD